MIFAQSQRLDILERDRLAREARRSSLVQEAVAKTNRQTKTIEKWTAWLLYAGAILAICHALAVELDLMSSYTFFWWAGIPVALIGAYYLIQDVRQKPKRGFDDLLTMFAKSRLRRLLMYKGVGDVSFDQLTVHQSQFTIVAAADLATQPAHLPLTPISPALQAVGTHHAQFRRRGNAVSGPQIDAAPKVPVSANESIPASSSRVRRPTGLAYKK